MAGFLSPQIPLGLSAPAGTVQPGYRSLLAHWAGGANAISPTEQAGVRSMLAFWMGGAFSGAASIVPPVVEQRRGQGGFGYRGKHRVPFGEEWREDEEIILTAIAAWTVENG